ncbi:MAG: 2-polyprenyl-3-methyl-5-hydroxy-6-metoxy-1,4-benzoquinol methylase [Planctomycetaceae bacterium]|jgi:2-polyprenyl-3-methyl-5-hydroxy-6-metoxy-1,4-benzoquinol methylase
MAQLLEVNRMSTGELAGESANDRDVTLGGCPLCGQKSRLQFQKQGIWIRECSACRHRYAVPDTPDEHVATIYDDDYFFGGGAGYADYLSEAELLTAHGRRYAKILNRFATPARILDVGAAAGFVLKGLTESGWTGAGVEPNSAMARHARETLGLDVHCGTLETMPGEQFDVVSMIQVMAHFVDPHEAAARVSKLVAMNGLCLVETWNVRSWSARLFGENWHEYSPPSVLQWFSPETLTTLFARHGFEIVARGRPSKKISVGHARSLLQHGQTTSPLARIGASILKSLPGRLTLPYPSEDLFWMVFRKV